MLIAHLQSQGDLSFLGRTGEGTVRYLAATRKILESKKAGQVKSCWASHCSSLRTERKRIPFEHQVVLCKDGESRVQLQALPVVAGLERPPPRPWRAGAHQSPGLSRKQVSPCIHTCANLHTFYATVSNHSGFLFSIQPLLLTAELIYSRGVVPKGEGKPREV